MDTRHITVQSNRLGAALPAQMLVPLDLAVPAGRRRPECGTPDNEQDTD